MARDFIMPGHILSGTGALEQADFASLGRKALVVTDPVMVSLGNCGLLLDILQKQRVQSFVYAGITGEPTDRMIEDGLHMYQQNGCDCIIGLGGGSPIDSMKAIGALVENGGCIADFMGKPIDVSMPPMAAIPTTAGTGSEATQFTIITDTEKDIKMLLKGACLLPDLAIIDPRFSMTAPPKVTAATGLDALCHCVEAFTSRKAQALSDTFAVSAVKRIFRYLPKAYHDGTDAEARIEMATAALEAGIAFNNASVTVIHGMSRPIGALFHVAHGLSNAMLIQECLTFALPGAYDRFGLLGRAIGCASPEDPDQAAAEKFLAAVMDLTKELDTPTLAAYGIEKDAFFAVIDKMAHDAMASGSPQNTRREVTEEDVKEIYKKLYKGDETL